MSRTIVKTCNYKKKKNEFYFSEVHRSMNALGPVQSWASLTLHGTHFFHTSMNLRKKKDIYFLRIQNTLRPVGISVEDKNTG